MNLFGLLDKLNPAGAIIILLIVLVFIASFISNLIIKMKYLRIQDDLDNRQQRKTSIFLNDLLNKIVEDYKNSALDNYNEVNTQAIIEKRFNLELRGLILGERFVKNTVSILITLGLLGTFLGLTLSVGRLVTILDSTMDTGLIESFGGIAEGLVSAVSGMAVAFITSLFGIGSSILLTILFIIINVEESRQNLMVNIEEYLDNTVAIVVSKDKETEYTLMNKILRQTFMEFGEKIENTLKDTVEAYGDKLSHVVLDVELSSKSLEGTVDKFDRALKNFAENIRDFSEFNQNLKNNIERMDVNFIKVTEAMKDTSVVIAENYRSLEDFSTGIRNSTEEMSKYNRQVVDDISDLVQQVKISVSSIKELGSVLRDDMELRSREINSYQEKFSLLMSRLADEVDMLGKKAADTFSRSLDENSSILVKKVIMGMEESLTEVFSLLDSFKENEKALAKTIAMLPDQALTYNEAAAAKMEKHVEDIKKVVKGSLTVINEE